MKESLKKYYKNTVMQESLLFFLMGAGLFIYALINHYSFSVEWKMSPYLFPVLISIFIMGLSVSLFFDGKTEVKNASLEEKEEKSEKKKSNAVKVLVTVMMSLAYYILFPIIGFIPSTILFLLGLLFYLGERRWYLLLSISVVTALSIYFIFGKLLHVMLP